MLGSPGFSLEVVLIFGSLSQELKRSREVVVIFFFKGRGVVQGQPHAGSY